MKLENKHYWAIGTAVVLITAGVIIYRLNKDKIKNGNSGGSSNVVEDGEYEDLSASEEASEIRKGESKFPLKFGSENEDVKLVQMYMNSVCPSNLKEEGVYPLEIDGKWGNDTDKASLACGALKRNNIDENTLKIIKRDLSSANLI